MEDKEYQRIRTNIFRYNLSKFMDEMNAELTPITITKGVDKLEISDILVTFSDGSKIFLNCDDDPLETSYE